MKTNAEVKLWGKTIGAVSFNDSNKYTSFEYNSDFIQSGIQVSPIVMPLKKGVFIFPQLPFETYHGLPGLLADSLPDKFGNSLINVWLTKQGRLLESFNSVERLCYTGTRGMGALEFFPLLSNSGLDKKENINVQELVELASLVLRYRTNLKVVLNKCDKENLNTALSKIISVGTSAGGARAKAVIDWNPHTNEIRSGQVQNENGFEPWLIKFSGVLGNKDKEKEDDKSDFGIIEYAYYLMAKKAGINISQSKLLDDGINKHFMTKRFDRDDNGKKIHMQSLCAIAHMDFNQAGMYSYEQLFSVMQQLNLGHDDYYEAFKRMLFNVYAYNCDDHTKNFSFLMNKQGEWSLSPAYDVTFAYNPYSKWTSSHQMTINGKRENFTEEDFETCAKIGNLKAREVTQCISDIKSAISCWSEISINAGLSESSSNEIKRILFQQF